MPEWIKRLWDALWFRPGSARTLRICRILLVLQGLWILLSRPDIPTLVSWPAAFFASSERLEYLRFGVVRGQQALEWLLWLVLFATLLAALAGVKTRVACAISGLLLYHFAPFEEIVAGLPHTHFGGLTVSAVGLLILAFAEQPAADGEQRSDEYHWPVATIQLFFAFIYFFAFLGKLRFSGWQWFTGRTIRVTMLVHSAISQPPLARFVASNPWLCWTIAITTLVFEATFWLCVFVPALRRVYLPVAVLFHVGVLLTMDIMFSSAPLLLLFVNWDWVAVTLRRRSLRARVA